MPHGVFGISAATNAAASCFATFLRSGTHQENLARTRTTAFDGCASGKSEHRYAAKKRK
jgi:hypothetical protein